MSKQEVEIKSSLVRIETNQVWIKEKLETLNTSHNEVAKEFRSFKLRVYMFCALIGGTAGTLSSYFSKFLTQT